MGARACRLASVCFGLLGLLAAGGCGDSAAGPGGGDKAPPVVRSAECRWATGPIRIDGKLDELAWQKAQLLKDFAVFWENRPPRTATRARLLWDDKYLYFAAEMEDSDLYADVKERNGMCWLNDVFELFFKPSEHKLAYYEFEINALNTSWDLLLPRPYKDGGRAVNSWEIPGLKTAVHVDGTLNDPRDQDRGWSLELAFPWKVLGELAYQPAPPRDGDQWRVNFSRVEWPCQVQAGKYRKVPASREDNWVWSPQGVVDMHRPERWGYVQFATGKVGTATFCPDAAGPAKHLLHCVYYAQRDYRQHHHRWARTLAELGLAGLAHESLAEPPKLEVTESGFEVTVAVRQAKGPPRRWHIRQDALVWSS